MANAIGPPLKVVVAQHIRDRIFTGVLRPGARIDQDAVAEEVGVSKLPVREALILLESEGVVRSKPRRGAYVAAITPDDIRDHYQLFGLASGIAARRAADHLTDFQLDELGNLLKQMDHQVQPDELEQLNERFHRIVNSAGGSRRLKSVLRLLGDTIPGRYYEISEEWEAAAREHHQQILDALRAHDPDAAADAMTAHIAASGEYAVKYLNSIGFWSD